MRHALLQVPCIHAVFNLHPTAQIVFHLFYFVFNVFVVFGVFLCMYTARYTGKQQCNKCFAIMKHKQKSFDAYKLSKKFCVKEEVCLCGDKEYLLVLSCSTGGIRWEPVPMHIGITLL